MDSYFRCVIFLAIFSSHLAQYPGDGVVAGYGGVVIPDEVEDIIQRAGEQDEPVILDILYDSGEPVIVPESDIESVFLHSGGIKASMGEADKLSELREGNILPEIEDENKLRELEEDNIVREMKEENRPKGIENEEMEEMSRMTGFENAMNKLAEMEESDDSDKVRVYVMENGLITEEDLPDDGNDDDDIDDGAEDEDEQEEIDDLVHDEFLAVEPLLSPRSLYRNIGRPISSFTVDKRRRMSRTATVQLMAVIDNSIYRKFLARNNNKKVRTMINIRKYYTVVVAMANERFVTIKVPDMKIKLVLSNIVVAKDREDAPWVEYIVQYKKRKPVVSASKALGKFQKWLTEHKDLPPYDHAMAFTSYKMLAGGRFPASGLAQVAGMCTKEDGLSSSIIVDNADYQSAYVIAHELGHSLGSRHDGNIDNRRCPVTNNFVMSPRAVYDEKTFKNVYYFSSCSLIQMKKFLNSPDADCLYDSATPLTNYDYKHSPPGRMFSADTQCKMVFGKTSGLCGEPNLQRAICSRLWCRSPEDPGRCLTNALLYALPGTTCGLNLHCERMFCVPPRVLSSSKWSDNETAPPSAPQGRKLRNRTRSKTSRRPMYRKLRIRCRDRNLRQCIKRVRTNPSACRSRQILRTCCQSCSRYRNTS